MQFGTPVSIEGRLIDPDTNIGVEGHNVELLVLVTGCGLLEMPHYELVAETKTQSRGTFQFQTIDALGPYFLNSFVLDHWSAGAVFERSDVGQPIILRITRVKNN